MTRFSKQREIIKKIIRGTVCHPTADWVYQEARKEIPDISLGTVYRNLRLLAESGEIQTVETSDESVRYDGNAASHPHFVCETCGKVFDAGTIGTDASGLRGKGYLVTGCKIVFYGFCPDCRNEQKSR